MESTEYILISILHDIQKVNYKNLKTRVIAYKENESLIDFKAIINPINFFYKKEYKYVTNKIKEIIINKNYNLKKDDLFKVFDKISLIKNELMSNDPIADIFNLDGRHSLLYIQKSKYDKLISLGLNNNDKIIEDNLYDFSKKINYICNILDNLEEISKININEYKDKILEIRDDILTKFNYL